jgi:hypothetical protein
MDGLVQNQLNFDSALQRMARLRAGFCDGNAAARYNDRLTIEVYSDLQHQRNFLYPAG